MLFHYRTKDKEGNYLDGALEAIDKNEVIEKLEERGLFVVSLNEMEKKRVTSGSIAGRAKEPVQSDGAKASYKKPIIIAALILIVLIAASIKLASRKEYNYQVVRIEDLSRRNYVRKEFKVVIDEDILNEDLKKVSKMIYKKKKKSIPEMEETQFSYYYQGLNVRKDQSVAVVWWNRDRSGTWDILVPLKERKRSEKAGDGLRLTKENFDYGVSVTYKLVVPGGTSLSRVEKMARDNLSSLRDQWDGKVKFLEMEVFFDGFTIPLMECKWAIADPRVEKPECKYLKTLQ